MTRTAEKIITAKNANALACRLGKWKGYEVCDYGFGLGVGMSVIWIVLAARPGLMDSR